MPEEPLIYCFGFTSTTGFGVIGHLTHHLALYQISVRRLVTLLRPSFIHSITEDDLGFTTLAVDYSRLDFHQLELRHARHTKKRRASLPGRPSLMDRLRRDPPEHKGLPPFSA